MKFETLKSRVLPITAIGATAISLNGCVCANIANTSSFVFGCPPEAPKATKVSHYTSLPGDKGKIKIKLFCVDPASGAKMTPIQVEERSSAFKPTVPGERQYEVDAQYGVNIDNGHTELRQPNASTVILQGDIVNVDYVTSAALISTNYQSASEFLGK